jgi:histidinol-phosphate aminotransferase
MLNVGDGHAIFEKLLRQGIIVRPLKGYSLPEWVRVSVGTMEENKKLIAALKEVMRDKQPGKSRSKNGPGRPRSKAQA